MLLGLIVPSKGRVLVDETPLTPGLLPAWRDQIGYVPQDSFHFHDTVRANLLWARPDASEAELQVALEVATAGFVKLLPQGLDTVLGDAESASRAGSVSGSHWRAPCSAGRRC